MAGLDDVVNGLLRSAECLGYYKSGMDSDTPKQIFTRYVFTINRSFFFTLADERERGGDFF
jgi:hypothetical protein